MNNPYEYSGKSLTPKMARELILELFAGKTAPRQDIIGTVDELHVERGGRMAETKVHPVVNALNWLKSKGFADNVDLGVWKINGKTEDQETDDTDDSNDGVRRIGSGNHSVYVYYYPAYRELAELRGEETWHCKIGRSEYANPIHRILEQQGTAMSEEPEIALVIQTNQPTEVENAIHNLLDRDRISDAPGTEWFMTNPSRVEEIFNIINKSYS